MIVATEKHKQDRRHHTQQNLEPFVITKPIHYMADTGSHGAGARASRGGQPAAKGFGRCQHETGQGGQRYRGFRRELCWKPSWSGKLTRSNWPSWPRGEMRKKLPQLRQVLAGRFEPHHRFLISEHL